MTKLRCYFTLIVVLLLAGCNDRNNVPFPGQETEFAPMVSRPISFTTANPLEFEITGQGAQPSSKPFHLDKIPATPFYLDGFQPLLKPADKMPFDWDKLQDTILNWDKLPEVILRYKTSLLPKPVITKSKMPEMNPGSPESIFFFDNSGLVEPPARRVLQDKDGLLWIATDGGLSYFVVAVSTKKAADKVIITVKDSGNGIPAKVLDKIFQPFFTTKPTGKGTGLGLSLAYDIVKAHGGELTVTTKEGEGTTVMIRLPI